MWGVGLVWVKVYEREGKGHHSALAWSWLKATEWLLMVKRNNDDGNYVQIIFKIIYYTAIISIKFYHTLRAF